MIFPIKYNNTFSPLMEKRSLIKSLDGNQLQQDFSACFNSDCWKQFFADCCGCCTPSPLPGDCVVCPLQINISASNGCFSTSFILDKHIGFSIWEGTLSEGGYDYHCQIDLNAPPTNWEIFFRYNDGLGWQAYDVSGLLSSPVSCPPKGDYTLTDTTPLIAPCPTVDVNVDFTCYVCPSTLKLDIDSCTTTSFNITQTIPTGDAWDGSGGTGGYMYYANYFFDNASDTWTLRIDVDDGPNYEMYEKTGIPFDTCPPNGSFTLTTLDAGLTCGPSLDASVTDVAAFAPPIFYVKNANTIGIDIKKLKKLKII